MAQGYLVTYSTHAVNLAQANVVRNVSTLGSVRVNMTYGRTRAYDTSHIVGGGIGKVWVDMAVEILDDCFVGIDDLMKLLRRNFISQPC